MRISLYVRVSKSDDSQDPANQLIALRDYAKVIGGEIVAEYADYGSGGNSDREQFRRMLHDAKKRSFHLVLIWSLDRLSREGISNTLGYLERLKRCGVGVKSLQESWLDTRDEGLGELMLAIFSWVAQQERKRIIERTKAGLEKARRSGKRLGRPSGAKDKRPRKRSGYWLRYHKESGNGTNQGFQGA